MLIKGKVTLLFIGLLLLYSCDNLQESLNIEDNNYGKEDAIELTLGSSITAINNGVHDTSDYYQFHVQTNEVIELTNSDNLEVTIEGDITKSGSSYSVNSDGTVYLLVKYLDNYNGDFTVSLKSYDNNYGKEDAIELTLNSSIIPENNGEEDYSDYYSINAKAGNIIEITNSDNLELTLEGDITKSGSSYSVNSDGTVYLLIKYLDNNNGDFTVSLKSYDNNYGKEDAIPLKGYNTIFPENNGINDLSDYYKIDVRTDHVIKFSNSDNLELIFEGDVTVTNNTATVNSNGTVYLLVKYLDDTNGSFYVKVEDKTFTNDLSKIEWYTYFSTGFGTITHNEEDDTEKRTASYAEVIYYPDGKISANASLTNDPEEYPYVNISLTRKAIDTNGIISPPSFNLQNVKSIIITYETTHPLRFSLIDDTENYTGFSHYLTPTTAKTTVEIKVEDLKLNEWATVDRQLIMDNVFELIIGMNGKVDGNFTFYEIYAY